MNDKLSSDLASLRIERATPRAGGGIPKWLVTAAIAAAAIAAVIVGWNMLSARVLPTAVDTTEIAAVSTSATSVELTATGYLVPQVVAKVGGKTTGRVSKTFITEGQVVELGALLFELDPVDQQSAVASAKARVAVAQARALTARASLAEVALQLERQRKLAAAGASAQSTVDDLNAKTEALRAGMLAAEADVAAAKADVNVATTSLSNMTVTAPIRGTAVTRPAQVGDVVEPLSPLVELADFSSLMVEVDVPESRLGLVKIGAPAEVTFEAMPSERLRGEVIEISPRLNRAKATATVRVRVLEQTERLRPEMSARVGFLSKALTDEERGAKPKIVVPKNALIDRGGEKVIFVIDGDSVTETPVTLGEDLGTAAVLVSGPGAGTRVVASPPTTLRNGSRIKERDAE